MSQVLTAIETTDPLLKRTLWFAAKVGRKLALKSNDTDLTLHIGSLKENSYYKVAQIEYEDMDYEGGIVDRVFVKESFVGRFIRCEDDQVLVFDEVVDFLNNDKTKSVEINQLNQWSKLEIIEVDINNTNGEDTSDSNADDIYDIDDVSSADFQPIVDQNLDYENKVEITPCNLRGHEIISNLTKLLNKDCAVIWGERDLGDFYLKSISEAEAAIEFTFRGGDMVFTIFRDKIRVVVSNKNHTKSEIRDRTDTLHIIPKSNQ